VGRETANECLYPENFNVSIFPRCIAGLTVTALRRQILSASEWRRLGSLQTQLQRSDISITTWNIVALSRHAQVAQLF
jgi:hypothetical protein